MNTNRRRFLKTAAAGAALSVRNALAGNGQADSIKTVAATVAEKPALLGGTPVHKGGWLKWPQWRESWEPGVLEVLRSCKWYRGAPGRVEQFETAYAKLLGARRCLATACTI